VRLALDDNSATGAVNLGEEPVSGPALTAAGRIIVGTQTIPPPDPVFKLNHYTGFVEDWDMVIPGNYLGGVAVDSADRMYIGTFFLEDVVVPGTNGISCIRPDQTVAWFYPTADRLPFAPVVADDNLLLCVVTDQLFGAEGTSLLLGIRGS
jgi:hypothetical protein